MNSLFEYADIYKALQEQEKEKIVAFVDVLGFQRKVEEDPMATALINLIIKICEDASHEKSSELVTFFFSDCMYIVGDNLDVILDLIAHIQIMVLKASKKDPDGAGEKYCDLNLIRGGITKGMVMVDSQRNILLGKAVNRAYFLESQLAIYPRVVLDREFCVDDVNYFVKDFDGLLYFDYFCFFKNKKVPSMSVGTAKAMQDYIWKYVTPDKKTNNQSDDKNDDETVANKEGESDNNSPKKPHDERVKCKLQWFDHYLQNSLEYLY